MNQKNIFSLKIVVVYLILLCLVSTASAYNDSEKYWQYSYCPFTIDSSIPSSWNTPINSAMNTWNNAGADFYFYTLGGQNNKIKRGSTLKPSYIAQAAVTVSGNYITQVVITFNSSKPWSTTGASGYYDVQNVAAHELGHALKLNDVFTLSEATLYRYTALGETKKRTLYSDDINGIIHIYGSA